MRSWICPECGRECSQYECDCAACTGTDHCVAALVLLSVESLAQIAEIPAEPVRVARPAEVTESGPTPEAISAALEQLAMQLLDNPPVPALPEPPPVSLWPSGVPEPRDYQPKPAPPAIEPECLRPLGVVAIPRLPQAAPIPIVRPMPVHYTRPQRNRLGFPSWIITFVISTVVFLAIASAVQKLKTVPDASANSAVPAQASAPEVVPERPLVAVQPEPEHPYARFIEVTGLQVVTDASGGPRVQYLVVNHGPVDIVDIGLRIAVRSAASEPGSQPLFSVGARVPSLLAHQSKEIRTGLDVDVRVAQLPEWANLRTDVKILSQQ